eukprot:COSAG05_NODE_10_length_39559_cov_64.255423_11_plen_1041_part_00
MCYLLAAAAAASMHASPTQLPAFGRRRPFLQGDGLPLGSVGPNLLQAQVDHAISHKLDYVRLPPGTYHTLPSAGNKNVHLQITGARDLIVDGTGALLLATTLTRAIDIKSCSNLTIIGLTIDYDPLPFTQGQVVAVDPSNSSVDVLLDVGYPRTLLTRVRFVGPHSLREKDGTNYPWGATASWVSHAPGGATVRVSKTGIGLNVMLGDLAYFSGGPQDSGIPHAISTDPYPLDQPLEQRCENITLKGVTIYSAPGMGFVDAEQRGGTVLDSVRVIPGPKPAGATRQRLTSTSWDAFNFGGGCGAAGAGPRVTNCTVIAAGDDSFSVQPSDFLVLKATPTEAGLEVILGSRSFSGVLFVGDSISRGVNEPELVITATGPRSLRPEEAGLSPVVLQQLLSAEPYTLWSLGASSARCLNITLGSTALAPTTRPQVGQSFYAVTRQCSGWVLDTSHFDSSGRVLVKSSGGKVANNTFIGGKGIVLDPELPGGGAAAVTDIVIVGNHIHRANGHQNMPYSDQAAAVSVSARGVAQGSLRNLTALPVFARLSIHDNVFESTHGCNVLLSSAIGVSLAHNTFAKTFETSATTSGADFHINEHALVFLAEVDRVSFDENHVTPSGTLGPGGVACVSNGSGVGRVTGLPTTANRWCHVAVRAMAGAQGPTQLKIDDDTGAEALVGHGNQQHQLFSGSGMPKSAKFDDELGNGQQEVTANPPPLSPACLQALIQRCDASRAGGIASCLHCVDQHVAALRVPCIFSTPARPLPTTALRWCGQSGHRGSDGSLRIALAGGTVQIKFDQLRVAASSNWTKMWFPNVAVTPRLDVAVVMASTGCDGQPCNGSRNGDAPDFYITRDGGNSFGPVQPSPGQTMNEMGDWGVGDSGALPFPSSLLPAGEFIILEESCRNARIPYQPRERPCIASDLTSELWSWVRNRQVGTRVENVENKTVRVSGMPPLAGDTDGEGSTSGGINGLWSKALRLRNGHIMISYERQFNDTGIVCCGGGGDPQWPACKTKARRCNSLVFATSSDGGNSFHYKSRLDWVP